MISQQTKTKVLQVVNVFETGRPDGKYDSVVRYADGPNNIRQITFGRSQTTEYGNLSRLLEKYVSMNGKYSSNFNPYVPMVGKTPLTDDDSFISLLKTSAREDDVMRQCQDEFFDIYYYQPAFIWFNGHGFQEPLSLLVIYDSFIHSGSIPNFLRQKFSESPPINGGNEQSWIGQYVNARHDWLVNNSKDILRKTAYRTECFQEQIRNGNWQLAQPVAANGITLS
jgi:chitosanase